LSVQSLTPSLPALREAFPTPRTGDRSRRPPPHDDADSASPEAYRDESPAEAPSLVGGEPFAAIIKPDLSRLSDPQPRSAVPMVDAPSSIQEFLSAFATLLQSVGTGDVAAARNAATALQLELFGGSQALAAADESGDAAQDRMLDDLVALIRFARLGELGSAEASAQLLARDMQAALLAPVRPPKPLAPASERERMARTTPGEPASLVQDATAAYESLMDFDTGSDAA